MATVPSERRHPFDKWIVDDIVMVALALGSLGILAYLVYGDPSPESRLQLLYVDLAIVGVFWLDYAVRLYAAPKKWDYVRSTWYELPGMVPIFPGMTEYGSLRLFRLLRVLRILRLVGALRRFEAFERFFQRFTRQSKLGYVALLALAIVFGCAGLAWWLEPETFDGFGDALWWAMVTATTVGYGDYYPASTAGRLVGVILMLLGVGLIGTFAGTLSSFLVERRIERDGIEAAEKEAAAPSALPIPGMMLAAELERLAQLREKGLLSDQEYERAKRKLLD